MDAANRKRALRLLGNGLCVATSLDDSGPAAGTITWISQASFTPPLVMAAIRTESSLHRTISASRIFAVHIVGKSQKEMATAFFRGAQPADGKLNGYAFKTGQTGAPLLLTPPAWLECRVVSKVRGGDHTIFVGEVFDAGIRSDEEALTLREAGFAYGG